MSPHADRNQKIAAPNAATAEKTDNQSTALLIRTE